MRTAGLDDAAYSHSSAAIYTARARKNRKGIHPVLGFLFLGIIRLCVLVGVGDVLGAVVLAVGWGFYRWIFGWPARQQVILQNPRQVAHTRETGLVGVEGIALNDLRPTGLIRIQGIDRSARAAFDVIAQGEPVVVESVGDFELSVRRVVDSVIGNQNSGFN